MKWLRQSIGRLTAKWARHSNPGQAIVLIALLFIALAAIVGLVVDIGTVLSRYTQLRRAVDAASVQASNQFREFRHLYTSSGGDMYTAAMQEMAVHNFYPPDTQVRVYACTGEGWTVESSPVITGALDLPNDNPDLVNQLCPDLTQDPLEPHKLVRVDGRTVVGLPFLSIVGWRYIPVQATGVGEAASIDLALVLDRSRTMANDTCTDPATRATCRNACASASSCRPFNDVRDNAKLLINKLYFPYDHVTIIQFDRVAKVYDSSVLTFTDQTTTITPTMIIANRDQALSVLDNQFNIETQVVVPPDRPDNFADTNIGGGVRLATRVLAVQGRRRASVWMMLLLTDGAPNATDTDARSVGPFAGGVCPPSTWPRPDVGAQEGYTVTGYTGVYTLGIPPYADPVCLRLREYTPTVGAPIAWPNISRTCLLTDTSKVDAQCKPPGSTFPADMKITINSHPSDYQYFYDADDYARDQADYMASDGIVAFVIGLGSGVSGRDEAGNPVAINRLQVPFSEDPSGYAEPSRDPTGGERLLRYIADMGFDPDEKYENKKWLCHSDYWNPSNPGKPLTGQQCGNYWYAAKGDGLKAVFEEIASRMFTRLNQ